MPSPCGVGGETGYTAQEDLKSVNSCNMGRQGRQGSGFPLLRSRALLAFICSLPWFTAASRGDRPVGDRFMYDLGKMFMLSCESVKLEHSGNGKGAPQPTEYFTENPTRTGLTRSPRPLGGESRLYRPPQGIKVFPFSLGYLRSKLPGDSCHLKGII